MPVYYDSKKLIPAPFVSIRKEYNTTDDGKPIGTTFLLTVKGKITADKGSPNSSGVFWTTSGYPSDETIDADSRLKSIIRKQEAIRGLFATDGRSFEVQSNDGSAPLKCNPRIKGLEFTDGQWFNVCDYTITLEADIVYINGAANGEDAGDPKDYKVSKATEEWNMEASDDKAITYRLTHSVSATGKRFFNGAGSLVQEPWENAKDYVLNKIGLGIETNRMTAPDVLDATNLNAYNYLRSQHVNELGGTFQVNETWLCFDPQGGPHAVEEFTINSRVGEDGRTRAVIEGNIIGLEVKDNTDYTVTSTKWTNAQAKWAVVQSNLLSRCETITGLTFHITPLTKQTGYNQNHGTITYNYEYDDRADFITAGALSEVINITNHNQADIFAAIPVLGRALGPVLQDIATKTAKKRTISIEIQMPAKRQDYSPSQPNTNSIITTYMPSGTQIFKDQDEEPWSPTTGRYSRTVSFTYE